MQEAEGHSAEKDTDVPSDKPVVETVSKAVPADDPKKKDKKKLPRAFWWWMGGIVAVLAGLGILAWQMGWLERLTNQLNAASVTFRVREDDTYALEGVAITFRGSNYTTDASGQVSIPNTVAGKRTVTATKAGYTPYNQEVTLKRGENGIIGISLVRTPEKLFAVKGLITDFVTGLALGDVQVSVANSSAKTDAAGGFSIDKLVAGDYTFTLSHTGFTSKDVTLTVGGEEQAKLTTTLVPSGQVLFVSNRDNGQRALYTSDYTAATQKQFLTPVAGTEDFGPITAPNGKTIVFSSTRDKVPSTYGSGYLTRLYVVASNGTGLKKVSDDVSPASVTWSSNSRFIYYEAYDTTKLTNYVRRFYDTTKGTTFDVGLTNISNVVMNNAGTIALVASIPDSNNYYLSSITSIDLVSGERRTVLSNIDGFNSSTGLSFSSDDKLFYYNAQASGENPKRYEVTLASATQREISISSDPQRRYTVSPNGTHKAFVDTRDGKRDLFLVDANNANETRVTTLGTLSGTTPVSWDSSGNYLLFAVTREGENAWYIVGIGGGTIQKIVDFTPDSDAVSYY